MPTLPVNRPALRCGAALALSSALAATGLASLPGAASANSSEIAIIQDGSEFTNPFGAFQMFRMLGANTVRVTVPWATIAPDYSASHKPNFNATDPGAYPADDWAPFDQMVRAAAADHLTLDMTLTGGAPHWAEGSGIPPAGRNNRFWAWKPNATDFGQFVQAVGTRYSGHYTPPGQSTLPRVHFWALFNEPNFGEDLGPQATNGSRISVAPNMYRKLLNAGWNGLHTSGHGHDTILIGEFAARGMAGIGNRHNPAGFPGNYGQTKPLIFVRTLYCLSGNYRPLRGGLARAEGCPTNAAGSRRFRRGNPALFQASGASDHPYPLSQSPVRDGRNDPNFAALPEIGSLARDFDRANAAYGSHAHFPIYNTEYGYITNPPHRGYVSPHTAAWYINWAEYLSYKNRRVKSYMQYLLTDPEPTAGAYSGFASGLKTYSGRPKDTYYAYRMPLYMPRTNISRRQNVEVWGAARPAPFAALDGFGVQRVHIQEKFGKTWKTINTATTHGGGYFDIHMRFARSGQVRTQWTYPNDPLLPGGPSYKGGYATHSISGRSFGVHVR